MLEYSYMKESPDEIEAVIKVSDSDLPPIVPEMLDDHYKIKNPVGGSPVTPDQYLSPRQSPKSMVAADPKMIDAILNQDQTLKNAALAEEKLDSMQGGQTGVKFDSQGRLQVNKPKLSPWQRIKRFLDLQ